jgi:YD repeat-containing protein
MAAIITEKFRTHSAKQFIEDFGESVSSTYMFIGRSFPWTDDTSPPSPANSSGEEYDAYSDMVALKKVSSADVTHSITRENWASGTTYDEYDHTISATNTSSGTSATNLYDSKYYVITDEFHVYKCIRTGRNDAGATVASTVKPVGTSATALSGGADTGAGSGRGYLWKYMYTVSAADTIKFVTTDFMPVKTIGAKTALGGTTDDSSSQWDVENNGIDGGILHVKVNSGGAGYTTGNHTGKVIQGDGSSATCTIHVNASNQISHITVTANGTGYRRASIDVSSAAGIGSPSTVAVVTPIISPLYGHGANPVEELGGNFVMVNSRLEFAEGSGDFPTDNDFRRIGLIQDPFSSGTTVATGTNYSAYHKMTLSSVTGLAVDDEIKDASSDGTGVAVSKIVSITGNVVSHIPQANSAGGYENFASSDTVYKGSSSIGTVSDVDDTFPEIVKYSGNIMYIENRGAVTRAADQIEDIKLIIQM